MKRLNNRFNVKRYNSNAVAKQLRNELASADDPTLDAKEIGYTKNQACPSPAHGLIAFGAKALLLDGPSCRLLGIKPGVLPVFDFALYTKLKEQIDSYKASESSSRDILKSLRKVISDIKKDIRAVAKNKKAANAAA